MPTNPTQKENGHDYDHAAHPEHRPHERAAVLPREGRGRRPRGADPHALPPGRVRADPLPPPRHGDPHPGVVGRPRTAHAQAPLMSVTKRVLPSGTVAWRAKVFFERQVTVPDGSTRLVTDISGAWAWAVRGRPRTPGSGSPCRGGGTGSARTRPS